MGAPWPAGGVQASLTLPLSGGVTEAVNPPVGLPVETTASARQAPPPAACHCTSTRWVVPGRAARTIPQTATVLEPAGDRMKIGSR
jgi:hypothetical protein